MNEKLKPSLDQLLTDGLSIEEDQRLTELLKKWKGGRISTPVFTELARMTPQPIVEVVLLRQNNDQLETLLIPRPKDDIVWPGMFHTPGATLRSSDFKREDQNPVNGAFERIQKDELNRNFLETPVFAGRLHRSGNRGPEVVEVYIAELPKESVVEPDHIWHPVDQLASNPRFIQAQLGHVMVAADLYRKRFPETTNNQ